MKILKRFWEWFNGCSHDWETIRYSSVNTICRDLDYYGYSGYKQDWLNDRICLKCHLKDFQIEKCKEYIKNKIKIEEYRQKLVLEILEKENNADSQ